MLSKSNGTSLSIVSSCWELVQSLNASIYFWAFSDSYIFTAIRYLLILRNFFFSNFGCSKTKFYPSLHGITQKCLLLSRSTSVASKKVLIARKHRRRKCERCFPNSLRPISYFWSIWELYVLDLKTKVFCRKKNQLHFRMEECQNSANSLPKIPQLPHKISAQFVCPSPKVSNFWKKNSLWVSVVLVFN